MIVAEIGLNHFGSTKVANQYINKLIKSDIDAITFQIPNREFYRKNKKLKLPNNFYLSAIKKVHSKKKKIGLALGDYHDFKKYKKYNYDFIKKHKSTDVLLLNSGGPPAIDFKKIEKKQWDKYHNQLFYSFCLILQKLKINNGGYIFYISSLTIKQPAAQLIISTAYRSAFSSVIKSLSHEFLKKNISIINIAPGSFLTPRTLELIGKKNIKKIEKTLPTKKIADPIEIGKFVEYILANKITQLSGNTIFFDGSQSKHIF